MSDLVKRLSDSMAEVAYFDIAIEKVLTMLPTGPHSAQVPPHWEQEARERARPYVEAALRAIEADQ